VLAHSLYNATTIAMKSVVTPVLVTAMLVTAIHVTVESVPVTVKHVSPFGITVGMSSLICIHTSLRACTTNYIQLEVYFQLSLQFLPDDDGVVYNTSRTYTQRNELGSAATSSSQSYYWLRRFCSAT
jgi:hypothetical protein